MRAGLRFVPVEQADEVLAEALAAPVPGKVEADFSLKEGRRQEGRLRLEQ